MQIPVILADTDLLFCAGVAHALKEDRQFAVREPPLRDQRSLEAGLLAETNAIALVADSLLTDLAHLARLAVERDNKLVLLTQQRHSFELAELPAIRGSLRRNTDAKQLLACLHAIAVGERWCLPFSEAARDTPGARVLGNLSPRQIKVMSGVARGAKNVDIARELGTSEQVVKNMLGGIYDLAGVSDRLELALFVLHHPELAEAARASGNAADTADAGVGDPMV